MSSNIDRIISLCILNKSHIDLFFISYTIDSSFNYLELLILKDITSIRLVSLLKDLSILPHLISLVIDILDDLKLCTNIYQLIFRLPMLKYLKISLLANKQFDLLPLATNSTSNSLEYLNIDYLCILDELTAIVSYTMKLIRLSYATLCESELDIRKETLIK